MDRTWKPSDLFVKLSSRVAAALAAQLANGGAPLTGATLPSYEADVLTAVWQSLPECSRQAFEPTLARLLDLSCRAARSYVLEQAREAGRDLCPSRSRVLEAVSTPDLAVRLYLDAPAAFERAHFSYATALLEQVAIYQGQYIADVIPSYDRRARMLKALREAYSNDNSKPPLELVDVVHDDRFVIALHRGAQVNVVRRFDGAHTLDPNLCQPEIEAAVLFRFDSCMLVVKAQSCVAREAVREAFVRIFVGDPHYFEARRDHAPRYRLTIDAPLLASVPRPSLVKAASRPRPVGKSGLWQTKHPNHLAR